MSTTLKNFVLLSGTPQSLTAQSGSFAATLAGNSLGTILDKFSADLSVANYAKNGAVFLPLTASTPIDLDLTALGAQTENAGDPSFATVNEIIFNNTGTQDVTIGNAASHPFLGPLGGTTPTFVVSAGSQVRWKNPAGWSCASGTNSILHVNPGSAPAAIGLCVGGA